MLKSFTTRSAAPKTFDATCRVSMRRSPMTKYCGGCTRVLAGAEERLRMFRAVLGRPPRTYSSSAPPRLVMRMPCFGIRPSNATPGCGGMHMAVASIDYETLDDEHRRAIISGDGCSLAGQLPF